MLTSVARKEFADRVLEAQDLQDAATMLCDWFRQKNKAAATFNLTANLWGFARENGELLRQKVFYRAESWYLSPISVTLTGRDFVTAASGEQSIGADGSPPVDCGAFLALFADRDFDCQCMEFRLTIRHAAASSAVVFYGAVQGARFLLKAVWRAGDGEFPEELFGNAPWPREALFLAALHDYRNGKQRCVPAWAQDEIFPDSAGRVLGDVIAWFLRPAKDGLSSYLVRAVVCGGFVLAAIVTLAQDRADELSQPVIWLILSAILFVLIAFGFITKLWIQQIAQCRRGMVAHLRQVYSRPVSFPEIEVGDLPGALHDPALVKYSREIVALGGRHFKDITIEPPIPGGEHYIRIFTFPEEDLVFTLMLLHTTGEYRVFPSKPFIHLRTDFTDGWRLVSANGGTGYRKPLPLPVIQRIFFGVEDPALMLEKHRKAVARAEQQEQRRRVPLEPERIIAQQVNEHEETRAIIDKHGYFGWGDAFRMAFGIVLPCYKEE